MPTHSNNAISSEHNIFSNELNNVPNMSANLVAGMTDAGSEHSPNSNTTISSQIIGTTPLSQIGCPLPIDHYASEYRYLVCHICENEFLHICFWLCLKRSIVTIE